MNACTSYEIKAAAFHHMTGMMAPGKDEPAASGGHPIAERMDAWEKWTAEHRDIIRAMIRAVETELDVRL